MPRGRKRESSTPLTGEAFAHELPERHLACRTDQHVWRPQAVEVVREGRSLGGYVRVMRCSQCRTERQQVIDTRGNVLSNRYNYADGYLAAVERGTLSRAVFRLEWVNRWLDGHPEQEVG